MMSASIFKDDWLAAGDCLAMAWEGLRADPETPNEAALFRMMQGREIGELARGLFLDGTVVCRTPTMSTSARTQVLIADPTKRTLFEAAFVAGPFGARADILTRES